MKDKVLDNLWSEAVKIKDGMQCVVCGKTTHLNSHHIFSRSNRATRWDIENGITLCVSHHVFGSKFSAHKTPTEFTYWLEDKKGKVWLQYLGVKARGIAKLGKADKEEIGINLTNYIKNGSNNRHNTFK